MALLLLIVVAVGVYYLLIYRFNQKNILIVQNKSQCPNCNSVVEKDYNVCPICKDTLKKKCTNCSEMVDKTWNFCPYCEIKIINSDKNL